MSGDWIKMRGNLWDDPRIGRICDLVGAKEATAIGALYWLWATADQHTSDGCMPGLSMQQIDRKTGVKGFAAALVDVGWLSDDPQGVVIQHFEEHNGASAKKRAQTAKRVANSRSGNADETHDDQSCNAASVTPALAREEKRREEKKKEKDPPASRVPPSALPRATKKAPVEFELTEELLQWAAEHTPGLDLDGELAKLKDHTFATARTDWPGTLRNWLRKAWESAGSRGSRPGSSSQRDEPEWRREQRERNEAALGPYAAKRRAPNTVDMEATDGPAFLVG